MPPRRATVAVRAPRSKYRAVPTVVDGIRFASKAEARRYGELKLLEKAGEICMLELQPVFPLIVGGQQIGEYRADFRYNTIRDRHQATDGLGHKIWINNVGGSIAEDVKGFDTPLSKWKRKHVAAQYGIDVQVIT